LNGFTEVAGPRTDLVIANPNGLTINGGGFINTGRLTLTTGRPVIIGGALTSLNVTGGNIAVQGAGLNTQGASSTSIYTQYLNLNAKLHAQNLDVKLGGNSVDYPTGVAVANGAANARTVLLDTSALGGMYANMITLVGTDKGLGVNLPPEVLASSGNITITNDGRIHLQAMSAGGSVNVSSAASNVTATKSVYAGASATLKAGNAVNVNSGSAVAAGSAVNVNAATLNNQGVITAGITAAGAVKPGGAVNITATNLTNTGTISGGTGASNITVSGNIDNASRISSAGDLAVKGSNITNNGFFNAGNNLTMTSTNLTNNKTLFSGNDMNLYTSGTLTNNPNANIFAVNNLTMASNAALGKTASIVNDQANIEAHNGNLDIYANSLTNRTNPPVIQGSYNAATQSIVGGKRLSTVSKTTYCGFNCRNVTTTTVDTMVLKNSSAPATIDAGGNLNVNATHITSQYSLMSAGGNIHLAAQVVDNLPKDILKVTTVRTAMYRNQRYCNRHVFGVCTGHANRSVYVGTAVSTGRKVLNTVASTIQAGGSITGNVANLTNGNIKGGQTITAGTLQTQNTSTTLPASAAIALPKGSTGLFVVSPNPKGQFLVVTNPAFASFANFIGSSYLLSRIGYTPRLNVKLLGDALYESRLIRDSIFAQTGRRFLTRDITSDAAQFRYLMDNALAQHKALNLIPGVALTSAQVAALKSDIVWLVEKEIEGHKVLVPVVYIADTHDYLVEGGKIIAGKDVQLAVNRLNNSGLMEAGNNLDVHASDGITNHDGTVRAGHDLSLTAKNDIENISADMRAKNITLVSSNGNIINRRYVETQSFAGGSDVKTVTGKAGDIEASDKLALNAGKGITVTGSKLKGKDISLNANQVNIGTTVKTAHFNAAVQGASLKQQSTTHLGSTVEGGNVAINTSGATTVSGSRVHADKNLNIKAGKLDVLAVNDSNYEEDRTTSKGFFSHQSTTTRHATSTNIGSQLSGGNVSLSTINNLESSSAGGDIAVVGSEVSANNKLALDSAKNIDVRAGFNGSMDETHTKKSGLFSGGALFSKSEDLEGKLTKTAVLAKLSGKNVSLHAGEDIALKGVNVTAGENLEGAAQNITVANVNNVEKTYSKHEKLTVGFGDALKSIVQPYKAVKYKQGRASITLARAEISKASQVTTKTTVVGSELTAGRDVNLTAASGDKNKGDVSVKGSNLTAKNDVNLSATHDVSITEAKNTEKTASKQMHGKAELSLSVQNEYVQVGYAVNEARKSGKHLKNAKQAYTRYKRELGKQRGKLIKLKADLVNGKVGIEQADVDEMAGLIDDLKGDDTYYKANIALAATDLATKTLAVVAQMAKALDSPAYGFSASLNLDIDALVKKFNASSEQSVASNVRGKNINIAADSTATVRGSNLKASDAIAINAKDTNILASQDVNTSSNSSNHAHLNVSYGTSGGLTGSASADRSRGSSDGITNHNSQLVASNIHIHTGETTSITGANVSASDKVNIETKNLDIASVQDSRNSRSDSQGFSISGSKTFGVTGVGANMGMSHSREKHTVLTTVTGNKVNIDVAKDTTLKGATIAATDSRGNDNGNLHLKTGTLEVSSLNNTRNSKSLSAGINAGITNQQQKDGQDNHSTVNSVGIDFANDRANSKTKTLGTIGSGNIEVASVDKSNTHMLNRDVNNNEVNIYDIKSHKGLKGTLDTRLLNKDGLNSIKEDIERSKRGFQVIGDVATNDAFQLQDTFAHISETQKDLDVQKAFALANGGKGIETLQGKGSTIEQKQAAIRKYADIYAKVYGINIEKARIIATSKVTGGTHYGKDGTSSIAINDNSQRNATDYANTMGHEVAHARVSQHKVRDRKSDKLNEQYANTMGGYSAEGMQFSSTNYNNVNLNTNANTNKHIRTAADTTLLAKNNANWRTNLKQDRNGNGKMDYRELYKREARVLDQARAQLVRKANLTKAQKQQMTLQLNAAACAKIKCAEGVPTDDTHYTQLIRLQAIGDALKAKGMTLDKMLGGSLPEGMFQYGTVDKMQDFITKHGEAIQRGKGAVNTGLGTAGTVTGVAATITTAPLVTTVAGALVPAGTAALTGLAATQAVDGVTALFGDYSSTEGQRVLDSFTEKTNQGDRNLVKDAAVNTALWVGETIVINKVAKLVPDSVKNKARDLITGGKKAEISTERTTPVYSIKKGTDVNKQGEKEYAAAHDNNADNYLPPHVPDKSVVLTDLPKDTEFVHVFRANTSDPIKLKKDAVGEWVMPKSEVTQPDGSLMSAKEIQQKFALPETPTHIVDVKPNRKVQATVSSVAGTKSENGGIANHFGKGGGQQWKIQEDLKDPAVRDQVQNWFKNPRPLGEK